MSSLPGKPPVRPRAATNTTKTERVVPPLPQPVTEPPSIPELLSQLKTTLSTATGVVGKLKEGCATLTTELTPLVPTAEDSVEEVKDPEELQNALFEQVKQAVLQADTAIDKACFKRRPAVPQSESKKGVTTALEQMADEIWRAVAEGAEKPVTQQLSRSLASFAKVSPQLESLGQSLEGALKQVDTLLVLPPSEPREVSAGTREELAGELAGEGQRMLSAFTRFSSSKKADKSCVPNVRQEMDTILTDMVSAVQTSRTNSEDTEGWRLKKEVARIRQKIQTLCKALEDAEVQEAPMVRSRSRRPKSMASDELEQLTEQSEKSSIRPQSVASGYSIDTEEIKAELAKHLKETETSMLSAISEQKRGFTTMNQHQASIQKKQDELTQEMQEIKRRLYEVLPASGTAAAPRSRPSETPMGISILKTLAPNIRAGSDSEFMEKFSKWITAQHRDVEAFLSSLRTEEMTFRTLDEVATEVHKLRSANTALQEQSEEALIKMIRSQSEFEIEIEFQKMKVTALEQEVTSLKENTANSQEVEALKAKVEELLQENSRLKGDAFDVSSVEPPADSDVDYSKNDELAYLKLQLHEHKQKLGHLLDERKLLEARVATQNASPTELMALSENQQRYDKESAEVKRLTRLIQTSEGLEAAESLPTRELDMKPADEKLAKQIMALLNLKEAFEICGMVVYDEEQWVLVRVESGYVWVNPSLSHYRLTSEEMLTECAQALEILETSPQLPRSLVLALGFLLSRQKTT